MANASGAWVIAIGIKSLLSSTVQRLSFLQMQINLSNKILQAAQSLPVFNLTPKNYFT